MDSKWVLGIVGAVVTALLIAYLTGQLGIGGPRDRADIRVVAFTQYGKTSEEAPSASIEVQNEGKRTAENCLLYWMPGMEARGLVVNTPEQLTNGVDFALDGGASQSFMLKSPITYGATGFYTATTWVQCSNTESPTDTLTFTALI